MVDKDEFSNTHSAMQALQFGDEEVSNRMRFIMHSCFAFLCLYCFVFVVVNVCRCIAYRECACLLNRFTTFGL